MNIESLGDRVKKARKHAGFTQVQLAKKVETSQGAISDIENGRNKESSSLFDIAKVTGVSADWLINNQGEMLDIPKKPSIEELKAQISKLQGHSDSDLYDLPIDTQRAFIAEKLNEITQENPMHESMKRLQEVAKTDRNSEIASDLNVGASTVTNWSNRGVSKEGALAAAEKYQVDANYILNGSNSSSRLSSDSKPSISYSAGLDAKERTISSVAATYVSTPSNPSVVELIDNLKELERQNKLTPELVTLLNTTIETFKKILEEAENERS